jgi:membrane protease subunit HflK
MYLETMQKIFTNSTKVMVDAKSGNNLLYLPLDKLIAQDAAAGKSGSPAQSLNPVNPPADSGQALDAHQRELRSRDSRDREGR